MGACCGCQSENKEDRRNRSRFQRRSRAPRGDRSEYQGDTEQEAPTSSTTQSTEQGGGVIYVVLFDYKAVWPAELSVRRGDRVEFLSKEPANFLFVREAKTHGVRGYVPAEYLVREGVADASSVSRRPPAPRHLPEAMRDRWREIPREQLQLTRILGEGRFGEVHMAIWKHPDGYTVTVVAKQLKELSLHDRKVLLNEAGTMKDLRHENVVRLYGVVSASEPYFLITEFVKDGSLQDYLKSRQTFRKPPLRSSSLIDISAQIARGMAYLASRRLVHRDLASRNILIDVKSESPFSCVAKVADFGLARTLNKEYVYRMKHETYIATRWLAPEGFATIFSTETDIWAFGITLAEIFREGDDPWADLDDEEVRKRIMVGRGPDKPPAMPSAVYDIMRRCCQKESGRRPRFSQLVNDFRALLSCKIAPFLLVKCAQSCCYVSYTRLSQKLKKRDSGAWTKVISVVLQPPDYALLLSVPMHQLIEETTGQAPDASCCYLCVIRLYQLQFVCGIAAVHRVKDLLAKGETTDESRPLLLRELQEGVEKKKHTQILDQ